MQNETNKVQETQGADRSRVAEFMARSARGELIRACRKAVECLEHFAKDARREVDRADDLDPHRLAGLVGTLLSASAWGAANAASELSTANQMAAQYLNAIGMVEAMKGGAR